MIRLDFRSISVVPAVTLAFFMNLVEIMFHPLAIFTVSGVLQPPADFIMLSMF
jgi:hypothetical protein